MNPPAANIKNLIQSDGVVYIPSYSGNRSKRITKFKVSLGYRVNSRLAWVT